MDYNNTSNKEDQNRPPMEKVEGVNASVKKKSTLGKFMDNFIRKDFNTMSEEFINQWLIPQLQGMIIDGVNNWLQNMFDSRAISFSKTVGKKSTDYNGISTKKSSGTKVSAANGKSVYDVPEIFVPDRAKAVEAVNKAKKYLIDYDAVPVDIFLDALDITSDFPDTKWGFKNLDNVQIKPGRDDKGNPGWIIMLPEPEYLGK